MSRRLLFSASWMCPVEWSSPETFVAMNSSSRRPLIDLPMMASAFMYPSAVSMNVRPASIAACIVEMARDSSYPPYAPPRGHVPKQTTGTSGPSVPIRLSLIPAPEPGPRAGLIVR